MRLCQPRHRPKQVSSYCTAPNVNKDAERGIFRMSLLICNQGISADVSAVQLDLLGSGPDLIAFLYSVLFYDEGSIKPCLQCP